MQIQPIQVLRHGQTVWENPTAEAIRKDECLCHHCAHMLPGSPDHCQIAQQFYQICKVHGTAFVLSRCDSWAEPQGVRYDPPAPEIDLSCLEPADSQSCPTDPLYLVQHEMAQRPWMRAGSPLFINQDHDWDHDLAALESAFLDGWVGSDAYKSARLRNMSSRSAIEIPVVAYNLPTFLHWLQALTARLLENLRVPDAAPFFAARLETPAPHPAFRLQFHYRNPAQYRAVLLAVLQSLGDYPV